MAINVCANQMKQLGYIWEHQNPCVDNEILLDLTNNIKKMLVVVDYEKHLQCKDETNIPTLLEDLKTGTEKSKSIPRPPPNRFEHMPLNKMNLHNPSTVACQKVAALLHVNDK